MSKKTSTITAIPEEEQFSAKEALSKAMAAQRKERRLVRDTHKSVGISERSIPKAHKFPYLIKDIDTAADEVIDNGVKKSISANAAINRDVKILHSLKGERPTPRYMLFYLDRARFPTAKMSGYCSAGGALGFLNCLEEALPRLKEYYAEMLKNDQMKVEQAKKDT